MIQIAKHSLYRKIRPGFFLALITGTVLGITLPTPAPVRAYLPSLDELKQQIDSRPGQIYRARIELKTTVYNPFVDENAALRGETMTPELPERGFTQVVHWIRESFLSVETMDHDGQLLNFYLHEGLEPIQSNLSETRQFDELDVLPPYLPFLENNSARWFQGFHRWGLSPNKVEIALGQKDKWFFLLNEQAHASVWVDKERLRPEKIITLVSGDDSGGLTLTIEFSDFLTVIEGEKGLPDVHYPATINYLINGKLFKRTELTSFLVNPSTRNFPVTKLRQLAREHYQPKPFSLIKKEKQP